MNVKFARALFLIFSVLVAVSMFAKHISMFFRFEFAIPDLKSSILSHMKEISTERFCHRLPSRLLSQGKQYLIALNVHNNHDIMPSMIYSLDKLINNHLGCSNVMLSVFESGSSDATKVYMDLLKLTLCCELHVVTEAATKEGRHRIEYLSWVRNRVFDGVLDGRSFDRLIFLNDVLFCVADVVELLYQSETNDADMTCGLDFDVDDSKELGFYDTWVSRDLNGRAFLKRFVGGRIVELMSRPVGELTSHAESNQKLRFLQPFQVNCCWNGISVLKFKPFEPPLSLRFHRSTTRFLDSSDPRYLDLRNKFPTSALYTECSGSEITNLCRDLHNAGFNRVMVVPSVVFTYNFDDYRKLTAWRDGWNPQLLTTIHAPLQFDVPPPESVFCHPMEAVGIRSPDGQAGEEILGKLK